MRISLSSLSLLLFILVPTVSHTSLIGFEGFTSHDPWDNTADAWGNLTEVCQRFNRSNDRIGDPGAGILRLASIQGYLAMPGASGKAHIHTQEFSMTSSKKTFDITILDVESFFYSGQDVYAQPLGNRTLKNSGTLSINTAFIAAPVALNFSDINSFALTAGNGDILIGPAWADHELCINDNSYTWHKSPSPMPEPSTLLILGAGLFGLARMFGRNQRMRMNH